MLSEVNYLKDNAETVADNEVPINTPMYFFISEDQEVSAVGWKEAFKALMVCYKGKEELVSYGKHLFNGRNDF